MPAMTVPPQSATAGGVGGATLVAGATGYIGKFVAEASLAAGFPTYVLRRSAPAAGPDKEAALRALEEQGAVIVEGSASDMETMERTLRELGIEVVISVLGGRNLLDQLPLIEAAKAAGTVKRFLPSEFGNDVGRADPVEPGRRVYEEKRKVRRAVEAAAIPYTYICCNSIAGWPYHDLHRTAEAAPPLECLPIYGDGNVKAYFVAGCDIGKFTVMAAHDPRALNKTVHFRPPCNFLTMNELASLWEKKIGRSLPRVTITENELLAIAAEHRIPHSFIASFTHDVYIKGCQHRFAMDRIRDVEVTELYPGVPFRTMEECLEEFAAGVLAEKVNGDNTASLSRERSSSVQATCA
ncbi:hypothetical protein Taro_037239 [Colocasia esculenta]|uniref:NmrA-like domain-containing protein n=1 Tax=Colocasia esculenta TaxID=4460 RepID=A0A843W3M6_COLES|nr:hypothetical protein [Colocasia esculenta]